MHRWARFGTIVCVIALAGCPPSTKTKGGTSVTASGQVPYPTDFTPPPPLPPPPAADAKAFGARYLDLAYARIGDGWTAFLEDCRLRLPPQHPLNDSKLATTASITLDAQGHVVDVTLLDRSGNDDFDEVARAVASDAGPFPAPDRSLLSDDDRLYLTWTFARDERQAGAATATLRRVEWSLDQAIPKFLADGNLAEAARRVASASSGSGGAGATQAKVLGYAERVMAAVVREGLASPDPAVQRIAIDAAGAAKITGAARELRSIADGSLDVGQRAAAIDALAAIGDVEAATMLAMILQRDQGANAELTGAAGRGLARLGGQARLGEIVAAWFAEGKAGKTPAERARVWAALIAAGQAPVPGVIPDVNRMLGSKEPVVRAAACRALGAAVRVDAAAWKGLRKGITDADASVRATCVGAIAEAAAAGTTSRSTFWQVAPLLKDRDERVRAAAVLAVIRLEPSRGSELAGVSRDKSPVVLASLAEAWVRMGNGAKTAELLKHESPAVRQAAATALLAGDDKAKAMLAARVDLEPALRVLALGVTSDKSALEAASTDPDPSVRTAAAARLVTLRGRAETVADVATQVASAPPASAERVRLAGAWLSAR
jgi:TonB family protein